jgi:hypothetical protein
MNQKTANKFIKIQDKKKTVICGTYSDCTGRLFEILSEYTENDKITLITKFK